jgi:glycosyltransferase involved in cell wall biosynthesis
MSGGGMNQNQISGVELIVGIPSYMEAQTIGFVTRQADLGIRRYFPRRKALIVNADNHSEDETREVFLSTDTTTPKRYMTTPKGVKGKGNNLLNIFRFCTSMLSSLKAVVLVDADLRSITPEWIRYLAEPIFKGYEFALPRYSRHQFDGTITNHICHPMLYGLMGENVRQPIGGEFAFAPRVMLHWLDQKWLPTTRLYGIDIFMTLNAILGKFRLCEVGLGAKVHNASSPKLGPMFTQVVTTFFNGILEHKSDWIGLLHENFKPKPLFGLKRLSAPQELSVDLRDMKDKLRAEFLSREKLLKKYLSRYIYSNFRRMIDQDHYRMDTLMWTQAVYQILFTFDVGSPKVKREIVEALKPLYFARSVTFDYETWKYRIDFAEDLIRDQASAFASQKPYFYGLYLKRAQDLGGRLHKSL